MLIESITKNKRVHLVLFLMIALSGLWSVLAGSAKSNVKPDVPKSITFDNETYPLYGQGNNNEYYNYTYLRPGESYSKFSVLINIHDWKKSSSLNDILPEYFKSAAKSSLVPAQKEKLQSELKEDYFMEYCYGWYTGEAFQYSFHRMVEKDGKVRSLVVTFYIPFPVKTSSKAEFQKKLESSIYKNAEKWRKEMKTIPVF